eukprot:Gb_31022 [translate_table: standard]
MTQNPSLFSLSKAKIKESLEEVHFGHLENREGQGRFAKQCDQISHNASATTSSGLDRGLQANWAFQGNRAQVQTARKHSFVYQDILLDDLDTQEFEQDGREEGCISTSSEFSIESTFSRNGNYQTTENRAMHNQVSKALVDKPKTAVDFLKDSANNQPPKFGNRGLKDLSTSRSVDNSESMTAMEDDRLSYGEENIINIDAGMNGHQSLGEIESRLVGRKEEGKSAVVVNKEYSCHASSNSYQNSFHTASPAPSILNGIGTRGRDCALDQRALFGHTLPHMQDSNWSPERLKTKVEELRISLLESSMEYDIKVLEMKMNMLQNKSQHPQLEPEVIQPQSDNAKHEKMALANKLNPRCLDSHRDQLFKLQREKEVLTKELAELKKRERQFELQRRNLQDAVHRVDWLERELSIKEEELAVCKSREKEAKAQLREVQIGLETAQVARTENRKLANLIPSLIDWLQSLKKAVLLGDTSLQIQAVKCDQRQILQVQQYECSLTKILEECLPSTGSQGQPTHVSSCILDFESKGPFTVQFDPHPEQNPAALVDTRREVEDLQRELEKLACFK